MISVCVATYNGEKFLARQLESILRQLPADGEIIVSDDGSTDSTHEVVRSFDDRRIIFINNECPHGVNGNFNNALAYARGDIVFLADQDDEWNEDKINKCVNALDDNVCVMHDAEITDGDLIPTGKKLSETAPFYVGAGNNFIRNGFTGCCMAFRKELLSKILPIPDTSLFLHDQWIGMIASYTGRCAVLPFCGIKFRRHSLNSSSVGNSSCRSRSQKLIGRLSLAFHLLKRLLFKR